VNATIAVMMMMCTTIMIAYLFLRYAIQQQTILYHGLKANPNVIKPSNKITTSIVTASLPINLIVFIVFSFKG